MSSTGPSNLGSLFVDTSAFKAFYDEEDEHHAKARRFMDKIASREMGVRSLVTSDYVMDETVTLIRLAHSHAKAVEFARAVLDSRLSRIIYAGEDLFRESMDLFFKSKDKEWSFTDCVSFSMMKRLEISWAFSFDPHFRQAGFTVLP